MITQDWLAGFFDGEGSIGAYYHTDKNKSSRIRLMIEISQKNLNILLEICKLFPTGYISNNSSNTFLLRWENSKCRPILEYLNGHCILKDSQIKLGLEFLKVFEDKKLWPEERNSKRANIALLLKQAKKEVYAN